MRVNSQKMFENGQQKIRGAESSCIGHVDFEELISEINKKGKFQARLESADDLYGIKKYNVMGLTPNKVAQLYYSICHRVYRHPSSDHANEWVGYELKIFIWFLVCYSFAEISNPEPIGIECWAKYSRIFHNKNVDLIEYQVKLLFLGQSQPRKWEKCQQNLLIKIMRQIYTLLRSNQNKPKWNDIAKELYFKSDRQYFRNPKQIRERWMNHLDTQICKSEWTIQQDHLIMNSVLKIGRKWAQIAKIGGGLRTQHMIKNRYFALLRNEKKRKSLTLEKDKILRGIEQRLQQTVSKECCEPFSIKQQQEIISIPPQVKEISSANCHEQQNSIQNIIAPEAQISQIMKDPVEVVYYKWFSSREKYNGKKLELISVGGQIQKKQVQANFNLYIQEADLIELLF